MEIKLSHIKTAKLNDVSINIPSSVITGVTGTNQEEILKVISFTGLLLKAYPSVIENEVDL